MPNLAGITGVQQGSSKTCWLACLRMLAQLPIFSLSINAKDVTAARMYGWATIGQTRDIEIPLNHHNIYSDTERDGRGKFSDLKAEIDAGRPLIALVTDNDERGKDTPIAGHYLLVIGYDDKGGKETVNYIGPADRGTYSSAFEDTLTAGAGKTYWWATMIYLKSSPSSSATASSSQPAAASSSSPPAASGASLSLTSGSPGP